MTAGGATTIPAHGAVGPTQMSPWRGAQGPGDRRGRTVLVVSEGIELAVALRDRIERAYLTVCDLRPGEVLSAVRACRPWPWMVIGDTAQVDEVFAAALARHPMLLLWCGARPCGLPAHVRRFALFSELAAAVEAALCAEVAGIRLAPGGGLTMPDGGHSGNAALEALVASHPHPLFAPVRDCRSAVTALAAHGVPLRLDHAADGSVRLASAQGA
jgi:hypothetical protein